VKCRRLTDSLLVSYILFCGAMVLYEHREEVVDGPVNIPDDAIAVNMYQTGVLRRVEWLEPTDVALTADGNPCKRCENTEGVFCSTHRGEE
jgi:hypothetical protein